MVSQWHLPARALLEHVVSFESRSQSVLPGGVGSEKRFLVDQSGL